ncbi:uncharacterized protein IL334_000638 [Kwoniella shivajii]|uniref:BTB domain-containing protein n=1 Tax=Kwoniella shivajii TaxID=564305 RepID=A0ABZ1CPP1_9TREE|nr:hypothetical protein IL334_000638 [Kwoniella shivajii]
MSTTEAINHTTPPDQSEQSDQSDEDTSPPPPKKRVKFIDHKFHNDPGHKIIIISNDNIRFKASQRLLVRASQFFRDLLSVPPPSDKDAAGQEPSQVEPIHLDFPSTIISIFLDLTSVSEPYSPRLVIHQARDLLEMVEFTLSDELQPYVRKSLHDAGSSQPLELFVIASERNDFSLARFALAKITSAHVQSFLKLSHLSTHEGIKALQNYFSRLRPSFHLELLSRIMVPGEVREHRQIALRPGFFFTDDWTTIAQTFDPSRFT